MSTTLAAVRPDPDDERQIDALAHALHDLTVTEHSGPCDEPDHWRTRINDARRVLAYWAEAMRGVSGQYIDPAPTEAELTAGDLAVAIEVARERAALLATVRADPTDAGQVDVAARASLVSISGDPRAWERSSESTRESFRVDARAVLAALAQLAGDR